ncbi:hypothetical protein HR060_09480 [Catenovulum sp. SM1970]|uniref:hypothetical protein n=1 Tax=Marinifaba aquimaris TaxID=2741323 RepID=UPI0015722D66|nr:hypothetical protein [Marinifaba aquimaris]NTS77104.1 hypothetical protein [Marinifaba aquimaris]
MKIALISFLFLISTAIYASDFGFPSETVETLGDSIPLIQNCNNCQIPGHHSPSPTPPMAGNHHNTFSTPASLYMATIEQQKKTIEKLKLKIYLLEKKIKEQENE